jgi:hypothetical protein
MIFFRYMYAHTILIIALYLGLAGLGILNFPICVLCRSGDIFGQQMILTPFQVLQQSWQ